MPEAVTLTREDSVEINPLYMLRWEDSQDSHVLLYPEGVVKLNSTAGEILKRCTTKIAIGELIDELESVFVDGEVASGVLKFLEMAHAKGWIRRNT